MALPAPSVGNVVAIVAAVMAGIAAIAAALVSAWWMTDYDSRKEDLKIEQSAIETVAELAECVVMYGRTPSDWKVAKELVEDQKPAAQYTSVLPPICGAVKLQQMFMAQLLDKPRRLGAAVERLCRTTHHRLLDAANAYLKKVQPVGEAARDTRVVEKALRQAQFATANLQSGLDVFQEAVRRMDMPCSSTLAELHPPLIDALAELNAEVRVSTQQASLAAVRNSDVKTGPGFGFRTDPFLGTVVLHEGQDFLAPVGTPVYSAFAGVVVRADYDVRYGNVVEIASKNDVVVLYAHLSKIRVIKGRIVKEGEWIGAVGATGRTTGPLLHVVTLQQGEPKDPLRYLDKGQIFRPKG